VGLSLAKLAALHQLTAAGESIQLGQLAERLACVKSNVTQLVDRLEADGLVNRTADSQRSAIAARRPYRLRAGRVRERQATFRNRRRRSCSVVLTSTESETLHELLAKLQQ